MRSRERPWWGHVSFCMLLAGAAVFNESLGGPATLGRVRDVLPHAALTPALAVAWGLLLLGYAGIASALALPRRRLLLGYCVALLALFALTPAALSTDLLDYIRRGRILAVHHANPYFAVALQFPHDPFMAGRGWTFMPSPYGPAFSLVAAVLAFVAGNSALANVIAFKLVSCVAHAANAVLVQRITGRVECALLYLCSPVLLVEGVANAHNDVLAVLPLLLALWLLRRGKPVGAAAALALAANIKITLGIAVPLWFWFVLVGRDTVPAERRWRTAAAGLAAMALVTVVLWLPFYRGPSTLGTLRAHVRLFTKWAPPVLLDAALGRAGRVLPAWVVEGVGIALAAALIGVQVWRARRWSPFVLAAAGALFALPALAMGWLEPWYFVWTLAVVPVVADARWRGFAVALTAGIAGYYVLASQLPFVTTFAQNLSLGLATIGPALAVYLWLVFMPASADRRWPEPAEAKAIR